MVSEQARILDTMPDGSSFREWLARNEARDRAIEQKYQIALLEALGYTTKETNGQVPTLWRVPADDPISFITATNEVVVSEVDGPDDEKGRRTARVIGFQIALKSIRYPLPDGWEIVELLKSDGVVHVTAIPRAWQA